MSQEKNQNESCNTQENCEQRCQSETQEQTPETQDQQQNNQAAHDTDNSLTEVSLWKEQCKRISAEFENFKKRTERDQARWAEMAREGVLIELLPLVDDFDRALKQEGVDNSGIEMMYQSLMKLLEKNDVVVMQNYESFDPEFHEAVVQVESDVHEQGQIVEVFSNGFIIKDRVLRPAKVSVAQ